MLVYIRVPYLQYIIEEVWVLVKQPIHCQHSLDLFSKHKEMNFDNFITVSLSVDFIISTGKLCSFRSASLVGSHSK